MLKNYLIVAVRNLWHKRGYTAINVVGLSIGIACCLLIGLFVQDEISYDKHFDGADRIVRISTKANLQSGVRDIAPVPPAWGFQLAEEQPDVEAASVFSMSDVALETYQSRSEERVAMYMGDFFDTFGIDLLIGSTEKLDNGENAAVVSAAFSSKHFETSNPVGEVITLPNGDQLTIAGVMPDFEKNTHFRPTVIRPMVSEDGRERWRGSWTEIRSIYTYLRLEDASTSPAVLAGLNDMLTRNLSEEDRATFTPTLQPVTDIHLHSNRVAEINPGGDARYVYFFSVLALLILGIACINYINFTTSQASGRASEVGVRKALGARPRQLATQFLGESLIVTLISLLFGIALTGLFLPFFNSLSGKGLSLGSLFQSPTLIGLLLFLVVAIGVIASFYPAMYLSRFNPKDVLRMGGRTSSSQGSGALRKTLVVFQFTAGVMLIACTTIVYQQLNFVTTHDAGFKKDQIVSVEMNRGDLYNSASTIRTAFEEVRGIEKVSLTASMPGENVGMKTFQREGTDREVKLYHHNSEDRFADLMQMEILHGRWFDGATRPADSSAVVVNEAAASLLGLSSGDALGERVVMLDRRGEPRMTSPVIGVVKDMHYRSMRDVQEPMIFTMRPWPLNHVAFQISGVDVPGTLSRVQSTWRKWMPEERFEYTFLDDKIATLYASEKRTGRVFASFSIITILIACLGLLGLASYAAQRRRKEVGVRRAMGATVGQIVKLLSVGSLRLVVISIAIGTPIAYYAMTTWLQNFTMRVPMDVWPFLLAAAGALTFAVVAVVGQALRTAFEDPTHVLSSE